jgi:hypothetical protein
MSYFDVRYLTLIGHVQSGKTIEEINYCHASVTQYQVPVFFIVRNITADSLQLRDRFSNFEHSMEIQLLKSLTVEKAIDFLEKNGIIVLLCNETQLRKARNIILQFNKPYHVCIDEVDFSIKSRANVTTIDTHLSFIKKNANHILGATATPFALFSSEKELSKIRRITPQRKYHGIETLNVKYVDSCIIRSEEDFPMCDMPAMDTIYDDFLEKQSGMILHTVVKERENHYRIQKYLSVTYPEMTVLVYNGDGVSVICKRRNDKPMCDRKNLNKYRQLINKYFYKDGVHTFLNYSISEVLQILVDDTQHQHNHISIISGYLASRGISFVSTDYSRHLTDQYFYASKSAHGENLLQSLRILGCYNDDIPLTLWCSEKMWKSIISHNKIINNLVDGVNNSMNWMGRLQEITINKPSSPLTRPRLCGYRVKPFQRDDFTLEIDYPEEPQLEEEI